MRKLTAELKTIKVCDKSLMAVNQSGQAEEAAFLPPLVSHPIS